MSASGGAPDRVVAWMIDPHRVLVAWDIAAATRVRTLRRLGARARHATPALRLASSAAAPPVEIAADAASHVLDAAPVGRWAVEVGFRLADGGFAVVARSDTSGNPVPDEPASVTWVAATRPTVPVAYAWSGRSVPSEPAPERDRPGASDANVR